MVAGEVAAKQSQTNPLVYSLPSLPVQIPAASATNSEHPSQSIPNQKMQPTLYSSQAYKPPNHQQQLPQQKPAFTKITSVPGISQKVRGQYQHNEQIFDELTHAKTESISDEDDDDGDEDESSPQIVRICISLNVTAHSNNKYSFYNKLVLFRILIQWGKLI